MASPIEIYQADNGEMQVEVRFDHDTVWLSQAQMAELFDTSTDNISLHLKNIFLENELVETATTEDYSVVRPFADGNKRSGAFLFVDFLYKNGRLFNTKQEPVINDTGLTALTLLIAESAPEQKATLIRLVMHMLQLR